MCAFIVMELLRITRQIHCKVVEQRATLIHRQYNWDWGTSHSRPPIDPYLTSPLLQNSGGATVQTDNHTNTSSVITQFFTGRMLFLTPSQQHQSMSINNYTLNYPQMARMMAGTMSYVESVDAGGDLDHPANE